MTDQIYRLPIATKKRILVVDAFRGFAILGIFIANITIMNCTFPNQAAFNGQWTSTLDRLTTQLLDLFVHSKFFPILSFLFGIGIAMQALRSTAANHNAVGFFLRRMSGLFIVGALHVLLLWSGDVVHLYALLGILLIPFVHRSNKTILIWAFILLLVSFL